MKIVKYLSSVFMLLAVIAPLVTVEPVEAQGGCAGGACGITTSVSPSAGPPGTQVWLRIESGTYPLDGRYEIWWSKSPNMDPSDPTLVKLAEGYNERRLTQSFDTSLSIPEATAGINYLHYVRGGREPLNFTFQVQPTVSIKGEEVKPRSPATLLGAGFTPNDEVTLYIDGEPCAATVKTDDRGNFTTELSIPDLTSGTHVIKATAKKLFNQEAALRFKIGPSLKVEPEFLLTGKPATIKGYGFAPESEIAIKFDDKVITSSPSSDESGCFSYTFTVPESTGGRHRIVATDGAGNVGVFEPPVENNPPTTPAPVSPTSDRFGVFGKQVVTFNWSPAEDDSGTVTYTLEVANDLNFFPLAAGMRRGGVTETSATMELGPGTYYWRVQAVDPAGNKSKWALSPYAFHVGMVSTWLIVGLGIVLLVIFVLLLRAFIQRLRGYYY